MYTNGKSGRVMEDYEGGWVEATNWRERWDVEAQLPSGGQGDAFRARRKSDGQVAFLKTIRVRTDPERRARFFREASAYDTFRIGGIPDLIESNAHQHKNILFEPYIVTRFIEGPTLRRWRNARDDVDLETAVVTTRSLLRILRECHAEGCVHRDVKPDNIVLVKGDPTKVMLLDFGLSYHDVPGTDFRTEHGQEVGNRFLRLPELSAGSSLKQDTRSDLSFAAGVLFYLLTGEPPDVLQDAEGRLPHQRSRASAKLQGLAGVRFPRLLALFDTAFAPPIADRFPHADAMIESVDRMMNREVGRSAEDDLAAILEVVSTASERRRVETTRRLADALHRVQSVHHEVEQSLGGSLRFGQTGFGVTGEIGINTLFWFRPGSSDRVMSTTYEAREAGDEIVIRASGETVFRTSVADPKYDDDFRSAVRNWLLARLRAAVSDPDALPPEADNFREVRPFARLDDAVEEARRTGRRILAFAYDPSQKERGQLQYGLGYFLQNRRTREVIAGAFVTALVSISQVLAKSHVLDNVSMEQSRWIVFDADFNPLEQAVIYANPQEGERIALDLASRFGP